MRVLIDLTEREKAYAEGYARLHSISIEEAFKCALFEAIEDEYDSAEGEEAYREYVREGCKSRPIEELWEELGV